MCGIVGFSGSDELLIRKATEALRHRGPDNQSWEVIDGASIGNARLAILDPRPEGNQPMWSEDRSVVMTFNGEIYNYRRLREEEKLDCTTNTDTEVVLKLYQKYGLEECVKKLRGMFAFGIFDTRDKTWHLARDPGGILPLFLSIQNRELKFASEMRTLMTLLPKKPEINVRALSAYVRLHYVPGPETMCEGIYQLPPGTILSWRDGKTIKEKLIDEQHETVDWTKKEFKEHAPIVIDEIVRDHTIADKPVGVFLSGGMDSSIVLHHMAESRDEPVDTFTVRFDATEKEDAKRFNTDADLAKLTAEHYKTNHHELLVTAEDFRSAYAETALSLDQPNADSVSVAQYLLAKKAKDHVDVILSGAGGDERFGGYPRYRVAKVLSALRWIPGAVRGPLGKLAGKPEDVMKMDPGANLAERLLARSVDETSKIVAGNWYRPQSVTELFEERYPSSGDAVRDFMEFDRKLWLIDESLRLSDAMTLAHGVESRVPFVDSRMGMLSHSVGTMHHVTMRNTKALIKETYKDILPQHLFSLDKASFYPPLSKWLRRECAPLVEEALQSKRIKEYFDVYMLRKVFEDHKNHTVYGLHTLQMIIQLHAWFESVYDGGQA